MSDQAAIETDVKPEAEEITQVSASESSTEETQEAVVTTPAEENSETKQPDNRVPLPRFKEVIDQKNEYKTRLEKMEAELKAFKQGQTQPQPQKDALLESQVQALMADGFEEQTAKAIVRTSDTLARSRSEEKVRPITQDAIRRETDAWVQDFKTRTPDFNELEPEMAKVFVNLPEQTQDMIVSDPRGIEFVYAYVKNAQMDKVRKDAEARGTEKAYQTKGVKQALSSTSGATPGAGKEQITRAWLDKATPKQLKDREDEIFKAVREGKL